MGKIPKKAKRVFEGVLYDIYQWEQDAFDGSRMTFEGIKRADSASVLATRGDRLIIGRQEQPVIGEFWGFLGGKVDPGETALEAGKRELLEESGLETNDWSELYRTELSSKWDWTSYTFLARNVEKVQEPDHEPGEKVEVVEMSWEEFFEIALRDDFRNRDFAYHMLREKELGRLEDLKATIFGK